MTAIATIDQAAAMRYFQFAKDKGCPGDQMERFSRFGYIATEKGLQFHAYARQADNLNNTNEIGMGGARGGAKSHTIFSQAVLDDCIRAPGIKVLYLRKIGKQAKEQLDDLRRKVLHHIPHDINRQSGVISLPKESRVISGHFRSDVDIDQYLGLEYEVIIVEEATALSAKKMQALRDSNRTGRDDFRPRIYSSANPGGVGHLYYKKLFIEPNRQKRETNTRFVFTTVDDNPYVDPEYKAKLEGNTGWRLRAYRYGDWDIAAGQFFDTFRHDIHVRRPSAIGPDWPVWLSMDYGYVHYTVVHLWTKDGDGNIYTLDEYAQRRTPVAIHAQNIGEMLKRNRIRRERLRRFVAGSDVFITRDDGPTIALQYKKLGYTLRPAMMDRVNGWGNMLAGLGDVEEDIPASWFISPTCKGLIETLPVMEHNPNNPEDLLKVDVDEDGEGGDDYVDGARYGYQEGVRGIKVVTARVDPMNPQLQTNEPSVHQRSDAEVEQMLEAYDV